MNSLDATSSDQTDGEDVSDEKFDVFISYAKIDCPSAHFQKEFSENFEIPEVYRKATLHDLVDPRDLAKRLSELNCRVSFCEDRQTGKRMISTKFEKTTNLNKTYLD